MKLIISEKNSVAVEIGKAIGATQKGKIDASTRGYDYLEGNDYLVSWCVGHLIRLCNPDEYDPKYKSWDIDLLPIIPSQFKTKVAHETYARYKALKILMDRDDVTELICATDAGREGELIFRLVYNQAKCRKPFKRLWISSVAPDSIRAGMDALKDGRAYDDLYNAAVCRQRADWLLGINLTRLYTKVYDTKLRIGRVKTPTVALIVQRDQEIKNFVKQPYYSLTADFGSFKAYAKIQDKAVAEAAAAAGNTAGAGTVVSVTRADKKEKPPHLYDLTMLQRDANKLLGYTAKQRLDLAQTLYEKKITTYPRTDSSFLTADAATGVSQMLPHLDQMFHDLLPGSPDIWSSNIESVVNEGKVSDHHALIPDFNYLDKLSADDILSLPTAEKNIFFLILFRLIAALSPSRQYRSTSAHFDVAGTDYEASGIEETDPGFAAVQRQLKTYLQTETGKDDSNAESSSQLLPPLADGEQYPVSVACTEKFTQPPSPYTEDSLLKAMSTAGRDTDDPALREAMKDKGLGTPATRAEIIEEIKSNGYVTASGRKLLPTDLAYAMISVVAEPIKNPETTSQWEYQLSLIQQGKAAPDDFLGDVTRQMTDIISSVKANAPKPVSGSFDRPSIGICPKCGKKVFDTPQAYSCAGGRDSCGFIIWKTIAGKSISSTQAEKLISSGKSGLIKGFKAKSGNSFNAYLVLRDDKSVGFEFPDRKKK